tara:strand:- start:121 stop:378 length:258 start_codon:yes stop_codon:yes gene_type:complete
MVKAKNQYLNILSVITLYVSDRCLVTPFIIEKQKTAEIINKIPLVLLARSKMKNLFKELKKILLILLEWGSIVYKLKCYPLILFP